MCVCCSVPDEGSASEDRSIPPSPEDRDGGLFLLKKDSERRAILYKVLNDDQDKVISNLKENHIQVCVTTMKNTARLIHPKKKINKLDMDGVVSPYNKRGQG